MKEIVMLTQPSCVQCKVIEKRIGPELERHPEVKFSKVNILEDHTYDYLNIQGTPHLILKQDGEEVFNGHINSPTVGFGKICEFIGNES